VVLIFNNFLENIMATFKFDFFDTNVKIGEELAVGGWEGYAATVTVDIEVSNLDMDYNGNVIIDEFDISVESIEPFEGSIEYTYEGLEQLLIEYADTWAYNNLYYQMGEDKFDDLTIPDYEVKLN
jgi:hypothetical protein